MLYEVITQKAMAELAATGRLSFSKEMMTTVAGDFSSLSVTNEQTIATIRDFYAETGYVLDPHTAVGVRAAKQLTTDDSPVVCLATAHPAKFGDAVQAAIGKLPEAPASLKGIESREKRCEVIAADITAVKDFIARLV